MAAKRSSAAMATSAPKTEAQIVGGDLGLIKVLQVAGTVSCSVNATVNGASTPTPLAYTPVSVVCGDTVMVNTMTNSAGVFLVNLDLARTLTIVWNNCQAVVPDPLLSCNVTLASLERLVSQIESALGNVIVKVYTGND